MASYVKKVQINNIFQCPYCLEDKVMGAIRNNKFMINPRLWNFQILSCGHVICNNCYQEHADEINSCAICREKTKVFQVDFGKLLTGKPCDSYSKSWKTLAEWFCQFNIELMRMRISNWDSDYNGWSGYYARIRDYSLNIVRKEQEKIRQDKLKSKKEKKKYKIKLQRELDRIVPKRVLGKGEMDKFIEKAKANIESNSGSYICSKCDKKIPCKHKSNHQKKCKS